ncbi:NTP transferase domain-containing protein [Endozoicomonas sp. Mp262]|uniref:NTP transferase domain-containing protein n=1 Tax=Endozoicomonas sp. Mp262 TaxID=2919499 RepID=UPI0021DB7CE9
MPDQEPKPVSCLITAAGLSSRMGQWKMMLPFGPKGRTILDYSIANALKFCHQVILVTGHRSDELQDRYQAQPRLRIVQNPSYRLGLFSSIQTGIRHFQSQDCQGDYLFISHGDMPLISDTVFEKLWNQRQQDTLFPVVNTSGQMAGHPVLIHGSVFHTILTAPVESRMKAVLQSGPHRYIPVADPAIHKDIDTPECYQQYTDGNRF